MALTQKKKKAAPTLDERISASVAKREAALSVFRDVVDDLTAAEQEAKEAAEMAQVEVERLVAVREAAIAEAAQAATARLRMTEALGL